MIQSSFGIPDVIDYILVRQSGKEVCWEVYDIYGQYLTECRTDCFDNYRDFKN